MGMIDKYCELWQFRELLIALTAREIKIRYKQTFLGIAWAILQPASLTFIFTLVFGFFLNISTGDVPYPIFVYSALVPWMFFSNSLSFGSLSVVNNGNLVTKIYFPREILPLSSIGAVLFDFVMASIVFIFLMYVYKISPTFNLLYVALILPSLFFLTCGIAFIFSAINVLYRDIKFVVPLVIQIWLFLTPIVYSTSQVPEKYHIFLKINPLVPLLENFRLVTVYAKAPNIGEIVLFTVISIMIFFVGYWFFKRYEKIFADVM